MSKRLIAFLSLSCALISPCHGAEPERKVTVNDVSRLNPVDVHEVLRPKDTTEIQAAVRMANEKNLKIAIAGKRHSQGGHTAYDDAVVIDMRGFDKVLSVDEKTKVVTVQAGATWEKVQEAVNPHGLSVKVMQASNIFTVGGSLSSNVHGEDPTYGSIIETVRALRVLLADGSIVNASRTERPELFGLVIGGFGLFGVILEVDLELTENVVYESASEVMDYHAYPDFFEKHVRGDAEIGNHSAKLSIAPESLLKEAVVTTYRKTDERPEGVFKLQSERNIRRNTFLFSLSRKFGWGKSLRWFLQKRLIAKVGGREVVCRNNAMRPIVRFLDYHSPADTDILQEYFVPTENFVRFIDGLREIVRRERINLLSVTVRHVPRNEEAFLSYARQDSFAVVLYINQSLSDEGSRHASIWTHELVELALNNEGTYYLTYQLYPGADQIRRAYPRLDAFFSRKKLYDPAERFMNKFYEKYLRNPVAVTDNYETI